MYTHLPYFFNARDTTCCTCWGVAPISSKLSTAIVSILNDEESTGRPTACDNASSPPPSAMIKSSFPFNTSDAAAPPGPPPGPPAPPSPSPPMLPPVLPPAPVLWCPMPSCPLPPCRTPYLSVYAVSALGARVGLCLTFAHTFTCRSIDCGANFRSQCGHATRWLLPCSDDVGNSLPVKAPPRCSDRASFPNPKPFVFAEAPTLFMALPGPQAFW